jgi:guanylate kinase
MHSFQKNPLSTTRGTGLFLLPMPHPAGRLIIVSAPSGAGKTTLVHHLLAQPALGLRFSVSATSRPMRPGEVDGRDYHFISPQEFRQRVAQGDFLEWEEVYPGRLYGSLRSEVDSMLREGHNVIFDVDVVGGLHIKEVYGPRALAVFIQPPSVEALRQRLEARNTEDAATLAMRIGKATHELGFGPRFDTVVVNEHLEQAKDEVVQRVSAFLASASAEQ